MVRNEKHWHETNEIGRDGVESEVTHRLEAPDDAEGTFKLAFPILCLGSALLGEADPSPLMEVHQLEELWGPVDGEGG